MRPVRSHPGLGGLGYSGWPRHRMSSIFLSHSSKDNAIAGQVKAQLKQGGHRSVFLDFDPEDGIPAGRDWEKELYAKLRECRAVIVLCSHASMASRWCFAEITHAKAMGKEVFPIKVDDCNVDPILTSKQVIDATVGWDEAHERLQKGLLAAGLDPKDMFNWDGTRPPYPGLLAFQEEDAVIFFGRDKEIREGQALLNRIQRFGGPRLILMLGPSGSGKSSLMQAGLLPRLKRDQRWVVIDPFRPLKTPFDELATVLSKRFSQVPSAKGRRPTKLAHVRDRIRGKNHDTKNSVNAFLELLKELREKNESRDATVLLTVDQCELLAIGANEDADRFLAFLRTILDRQESRILMLATLRSDFLGSFQDHPAMRGLRVETFLVPQIGFEHFASMIEGPAKLVGLELSTGLVPAMVNDTRTSDALPLLAFTLRELYEGYGQDKLLTLEAYRDKLGKLDGCIGRAAEAVLRADSVSEESLSDLSTAFLAMVRINDNDQYTKQPARWSDLPASTHEVLERFITARLLISYGDGKRRMLEVAHEALFRAWPRLGNWLKDNRAFLVWQQRLRGAVEQYEQHNRAHDFLYRRFPLTEASEWLKRKPKLFSPDERQFVLASQHRKRRERIAVTIAVCTIVLLLGATMWFWETRYNFEQAMLKAKSIFVSIHVKPEMVSVRAGTFHMGDLERFGEPWRNPVHQVSVRPFKLGKYEVTFDEYDRFAIATGREMPNDEGWGRGRRPVINVLWSDAWAYVEWLSTLTGTRYRLPTESEWEYAARSGSKHEVWAGTSKESELDTYAVFANRSASGPLEVGSKQANAFGIHDLSGNVWEWVEDCWHTTYDHAPQDGSALPGPVGCGHRTARGGSWNGISVNIMTSVRIGVETSFRNNDVGFRLAQDIY